MENPGGLKRVEGKEASRRVGGESLSNKLYGERQEGDWGKIVWGRYDNVPC